MNRREVSASSKASTSTSVSGSRLAPSPAASGWLGHAGAFQRDPLGFLLSTAKTCGPVARLQLGPLTYHLVSDPGLIAEVLQARASNYVRDTRSSRRVRMVTGESLLTSEGETWRHQRQTAQPIFHHRHLMDLARTMASVADDACEAWDRAAREGTTLELSMEMNRLSFAIAGRCLFGSDLRERVEAVEKAFPVLLDELFRRTSHLANLPLWVPLPRHLAFQRSLAAIDRVVAELIEEHRRLPRTRVDLLGLLMQARGEDGQVLSDDLLRNQVITFLLAGHETTANALTWAVALLAASPGERDAVEGELDTLRAGDAGAWDVERLSQLERLTAALQETLRLYPSIWIAERRVVAADDLGCWHIPAGSAVVVSPYVTHRSPEHWETPDAFRPSRFLGGGARTLLRDGYFPFGAGPHSCIGQHFALMEAKIVLATLLSRFRVTLLNRALPPPLGGITLRPSAAFPIRVERR
ncbi:MAG TPA: cytochrome P450 [Opitutaceae bacterium]|nr:cytochrome P450 [Opitutaceae bacterium]